MSRIFRVILGVLGYRYATADNTFIMSRSLKTHEYVVWATRPILREYMRCENAETAGFNWYILMGRK